WAEWCGPCRMLSPVVEEVGREFSSRVKVGKLNVDDNPKTASRYNVMSIPTLVFFKEGKESDRSIGVVPKADVKRRVESLLH
ncbi:MAG: thioredoxin, partial [Candidatus Omnitrophica bacterium]|nr:thioredoxin [Candidatus Omnitrophota bacterium]